ncbi:Zn-ribbon domain-containing OB-fold protein [Schinkia sp. CFF1]
MATVQVYECTKCAKKFVQRKWICPTCKNTEFQIKEISGEGKIFSFTTIHVSSQEFSHLTPYTVALIELQEGVRLTGRITEKVEINDKVTCISNEDNTYIFGKH